MILKRKIEPQKANAAVIYLKQHIEYLADLENLSASRRARFVKGELDDVVFELNVFISDLEKLEVTYPASSIIAMYLEFRKRFLISQCVHSESNISQIKELDGLFEYFNSNKGC